jgi:hypothetical protein
MKTKSRTASTWIQEGEKYALMGLQIKADDEVTSLTLNSCYSLLVDTTFDVPPHWKEWLGTIRIKEIENCNMFLLTKCASTMPNILNEEDQTLRDRVNHLYVGLLLSSLAVPAHGAAMFGGSMYGGQIGIRQQTDLLAVVPSIVHFYPPVSMPQLRAAATLAESLQSLLTNMPPSNWRLFRTLSLYIEARTTADLMERIHLFCRCIDGLILPDIGKTKQQFKSRTELFIGPQHHEMMGAIYDIRSAAEHLNESRYLEVFDRNIRLDLAKKDAITEYIARSALVRILGDPSLWAHFGSAAKLASFWSVSTEERQRMWGPVIAPLEVINDFDEAFVTDAQLGRVA